MSSFTEQSSATQASPGRATALSVNTASTPVAADLFDWAQWKWPELFPANPVQVEKELGGQGYVIRVYGSGIILAVGVSSGEIYALLPIPGSDLKSLGSISNFAGEIAADTCSFRPSSCEPPPPPPPTGSYNQCVDPAAMSLPTGFNTRLVYSYLGEITGEQTVESTIAGPTSFEGQNAIQINSLTSGSNTIQGVTVNSSTEVQSYIQMNANGLQDLIGSYAKVTSGGGFFMGVPLPITVTEVKTVFNPPRSNLEFTLQPGQSVTLNSSSTSTIISGPGAGTGPTAVNTSETHTFEAIESVSVLGKTYDTCRYKSTDAGSTEVLTTWYLLGKGVPVKIESTEQLVQLKSGTYNGAPL